MKIDETITITATLTDSDFAQEMLCLIENNDLSFNDVINILNTIADTETDCIIVNGHIIQVIYKNEF